MDMVDNVEPDTIVVIEGRYGVLDYRGFHPSPESSFTEEVQRDPVATMNNRFARARKLRSQGCFKMAQKLMKEANQIKNIIYVNKSKSSSKNSKEQN